MNGNDIRVPFFDSIFNTITHFKIGRPCKYSIFICLRRQQLLTFKCIRHIRMKVFLISAKHLIDINSKEYIIFLCLILETSEILYFSPNRTMILNFAQQ